MNFNGASGSYKSAGHMTGWRGFTREDDDIASPRSHLRTGHRRIRRDETDDPARSAYISRLWSPGRGWPGEKPAPEEKKEEAVEGWDGVELDLILSFGGRGRVRND